MLAARAWRDQCDRVAAPGPRPVSKPVSPRRVRAQRSASAGCRPRSSPPLGHRPSRASPWEPGQVQPGEGWRARSSWQTAYAATRCHWPVAGAPAGPRHAPIMSGRDRAAGPEPPSPADVALLRLRSMLSCDMADQALPGGSSRRSRRGGVSRVCSIRRRRPARPRRSWIQAATTAMTSRPRSTGLPAGFMPALRGPSTTARRLQGGTRRRARGSSPELPAARRAHYRPGDGGTAVAGGGRPVRTAGWWVRTVPMVVIPVGQSAGSAAAAQRHRGRHRRQRQLFRSSSAPVPRVHPDDLGWRARSTAWMVEGEAGAAGATSGRCGRIPVPSCSWYCAAGAILPLAAGPRRRTASSSFSDGTVYGGPQPGGHRRPSPERPLDDG